MGSRSPVFGLADFPRLSGSKAAASAAQTLQREGKSYSQRVFGSRTRLNAAQVRDRRHGDLSRVARDLDAMELPVPVAWLAPEQSRRASGVVSDRPGVLDADFHLDWRDDDDATRGRCGTIARMVRGVLRTDTQLRRDAVVGSAPLRSAPTGIARARTRFPGR